jgi:hypothetical protein
MSSQRTVLRVELTLDEEPVSGSVEGDDRTPRSFTGYVELIAALESIRHGEPGRIASTTPQGAGSPPAAVQGEGQA